MTTEQKLREAIQEVVNNAYHCGHKDAPSFVVPKAEEVYGYKTLMFLISQLSTPPTPVDEGNEEIAKRYCDDYKCGLRNFSDGSGKILCPQCIRMVEALSAKDDEKAVLTEKNKGLVGALKKMENPIECPSLTHCACADRYENLAQTALKQFGGGR